MRRRSATVAAASASGGDGSAKASPSAPAISVTVCWPSHRAKTMAAVLLSSCTSDGCAWRTVTPCGPSATSVPAARRGRSPSGPAGQASITVKVPFAIFRPR